MSSPTSEVPASASNPLSEYPPIIPGGSLIIAYQIRGKRVLIIGGGNVCPICSATPLTLANPPHHLRSLPPASTPFSARTPTSL